MRVIVGSLLGAAFVGAMIYALMQESQIQCEVCLDYGGQRLCRTGSGLDRKRAVESGVTAVCAVLSSGVTGGIECGATRPRSVSCDD
jgi:hypothetical protein